MRSTALADWLEMSPQILGRWLASEIALAGALHYVLSDPDSCLDMLEHYANTRPEQFEARWSWSLTQDLLPYFKKGTPRQRQRLKALEKRRLTDARGRPHIDIDDSEDVAILREVDAAEARLRSAYGVWVRHRTEGGYEGGSEVIEAKLRQMRYLPAEIEAILGNSLPETSSRRLQPCRSLSAAACRLVARNRRRPIASIQASASRGRRNLRSQS
jgi:hypothetical protein